MATSLTTNIQGADRIQGLDKSVWVEFTGLAKEYNACNLGQGFPDYAQPKHITDALAKAAANTMMNQYTRSYVGKQFIYRLF